MKRLVDRLLAFVLGVIAIFAGFAVAAELLAPFMATIVTVVAIAVGVATLVVVVPPLLGMGSSLAERLRGGRWDKP